MTDYATLISQILPKTDGNPAITTVSARVSALEAGGSVALKFGPGAVLPGIRSIAGPLAVNDEVLVAVKGSFLLVLGKFATSSAQHSTARPVGEVTMWAGVSGSIPAGWLRCAGQTFLYQDAPELAALLGSIWGPITGPPLTAGTTYTLPDLRGRFPIGAGGPVTGDMAGSNTHTHPLSGVNAGADLRIFSGSNTIQMRSVSVPVTTRDVQITGAAAATTISAGSGVGAGLSGNTASGDNVPAYAALNFIIRAVAGA